METFY